MATQDNVVRDVTSQYLDSLVGKPLPDVATLKDELLKNTWDVFDLNNAVLPKGQKWKLPVNLFPAQIAMVIARTRPVCCISCAGDNTDPDFDLLAVYQDSGPDKGLYMTSEIALAAMIREYNFNISSHDVTEVMGILKQTVPHRQRCHDRDLIAVNNGIFNYKTKMLQPFDSSLVFLSKSRVDYKPNPVNPVIHNVDDGTDWDVESWMNDLSDDPEIVNLFWEILGAIIRPFVHWNKAAWFYSNTGNNGKGTLCELMRNLCGPGSYASIPLADFSKDFLLEPLTRASAIIVDENDVGGFIDRAANVKAVITNDVIQINRKFKTPIAYKFFGFMVQCLNEYPRIKDKSDSIYRRQLFVPFDKCFTGRERRYIKADYLKRPEVLEYVLHKVLHMDYYELSEPKACQDVLADYKEFNDPVRQFCEEILPQCAWDLLPFSFLYDLYKAWWQKNSPSGKIQGKNTFIQDIVNLLPSFPVWSCPNKSQPVPTGNLMDAPELLIADYDLKDWCNPGYTGMKLDMKCRPMLKASYRGLKRV